MKISKQYSVLVGLIFGCVLLFIPLVQNVHFERAFLISFIASFFALRKGLEVKASFVPVIKAGISSYMPALIFGVWKGCLSWEGVGLNIVMVLPSSFFWFSVSRLSALYLSKKTASKLLGTFYGLCALLLPIVLFFITPRVMQLNPVWMYWPGPIYDEMIPLTEGLISFALYMVIAATSTTFLIRRKLEQKDSTWNVVGVYIFLMILGSACVYSFQWVLTSKGLKKKFAHRTRIENVIIYHTDSEDPVVKELTLRIPFELFVLEQTLNHPFDSPIHLFLYDHPWHKKRLIGAKFTQFVPVWLEEHQLHSDRESVLSTLRHELTHIYLKPFSSTFLNVPFRMGFTEGLPTALAPPSSSQTIHQLVAGMKTFPDESEIRSLFSFSKFYKKSSGYAYTIAGSFLQFIGNEKGWQHVLSAYESENIDAISNEPFEELIKEWHHYLSQQPLQKKDSLASKQIVGSLSIFEQDCPHLATPEYVVWDSYRHLWAENDTTRAVQKLQQGILSTDSTWVRTFYRHLVHRLLEQGRVDEAEAILNQLPSDSFLSYRNDSKAIHYLLSEDLSREDSLSLDRRVIVQKRYFGKDPELNALKDIRVTTFEWLLSTTTVETSTQHMKAFADHLKEISLNEISTSALIHFFYTYSLFSELPPMFSILNELENRKLSPKEKINVLDLRNFYHFRQN